MTRVADYEPELRERFPEAIVATADNVDMPVITVAAGSLTGVLETLRDEFGFAMLTDLSACDWFPREPRYDVNYHLYSIDNNVRLRVKVQLDGVDEPHIASASSVYPGANWHEREVYDFFGIVFDGHPDLRRILMPDEWIGHPLRKDYPVGGVPVEYRIEPAYIGEDVVPGEARPAAGGVPVRLRRDRGRLSHMTWTGPPSSGVAIRKTDDELEISHEGKDE